MTCRDVTAKGATGYQHANAVNALKQSPQYLKTSSSLRRYLPAMTPINYLQYYTLPHMPLLQPP